MKLLLMILTGFTTSGASFIFLSWLVRRESLRQYVISEDPMRGVDDMAMWKSVALNMGVSVICIFAGMFGLKNWLFYERSIPLWRHFLEAAAVILIYDFGYYFMHRFLFHEWNVLRKVHAVHHAANYPQAIDSLLLHPVETIMGLALLMISILTVGGIHLWTFGPIFVAYTTFNVWNHAGINIDRFPFRTLGRLAVVHDRHHHSMRSGNYASITPLPDILFGTVQ